MKTRFLSVAVVLVLVVQGCSGDDATVDGVATLENADTVTTVTEAPSTSSEVDQEQAMLDFAACMRDNGVDIEDPTVDADGIIQFGGFRGGAAESDADRDATREAMDACRDIIDGLALGPGGGDFDPTEMQDTMVEYAACMRENGYDMPDPDFSSFGPGSGDAESGQRTGPFGEIDPADPDFVAAQEACQEILAGFGPGRVGGPGGVPGGGPGSDGGGAGAPPANNG